MPLAAGAAGPGRTPRVDAFLSYAREDAAYAQATVDLLRRGGFDVWLDEERLAGGAPVRERILAALRDSGAILCLVTRSWLASEYCDWEAQVFWDELGRQRKIIPVLRVRWKPADLPVYFIRRNAIKWPHREPSEALYWLLRCALREENPGPQREWLENGRKELGAAPTPGRRSSRREAEEEARGPVLRGQARAALLCDRDPQWHEIDVHAPLERHEALFVQASRVEAPDLFLAAVERCFPESPARRIVPVPWDGDPPRTRGQFRCGLAAALGCAEPDLEQSLRDWLRDSNLVLVHKPVLGEQLEEEPLRDYYRELLPRLLPARGEVPGFAKLIQGVDWRSNVVVSGLAWLTARLWRRRADWIERGMERWRAKEVLANLATLSEPLPLIVLPPLSRIRKKHVLRWSQTLGAGQDPAAAVRDVLRGARTSADILARMATYPDPSKEPA